MKEIDFSEGNLMELGIVSVVINDKELKSVDIVKEHRNLDKSIITIETTTKAWINPELYSENHPGTLTIIRVFKNMEIKEAVRVKSVYYMTSIDSVDTISYNGNGEPKNNIIKISTMNNIKHYLISKY